MKLWSYFYQDSYFCSIHPFLRKNFYSNRTPAYLNAQLSMIMVSVVYLAPFIFDALNLDRWAVTLSLKGGSFWAYLPTVLGLKLSSIHLVNILGRLTIISIILVSD